MNYCQDDWTDWLSLAEFTCNNRIHSSTGYSPFWLNYGRHPTSSFSPPPTSVVEAATAFAQCMIDTQLLAEKALHEAADMMKRFYNESHQTTPSFKVGDLVLLSNTNLRSTHPARKLDDKHFGPFRITEKISPVNYQLDVPSRWHLSTRVFHVSKLHTFIADSSSTTPPPPPPDLIGDHYKYEVEAILNSHHTARGTIQYLIKWKNYGHEENSWEPHRNLSNATECKVYYLFWTKP